MAYFIEFFAFTMLFSAFAAAFIPLEFSLVLIACLILGSFGFFLFGKKFRKISALLISSAIGFALVSANIFFGFYPACSRRSFRGNYRNGYRRFRKRRKAGF